MKLKTKFLAVVFLLFFSFPAFSKNIAVLPFTNISGEKEKNWVGAGFSESLTTKLANVKSLNMIERQQLMKILDELKFQMAGYVDEKTAVKVGKMYGADVIVFGSFQIMGDNLRVSARFVDVETGKIIKTAEATGNLKDIFSLQDEIAFQLMSAINVVLEEKEQQEIKVDPTENLTAYELYSKGGEAQTLKDYDKAIYYYTKATELDEHFEAAYNNRGNAYNDKGNHDQAINDFDKAIALNPKLAEAYNNRGIAYAKKGDYDQAINDFDKAIALNPKLAEAYNNRGFAYAKKGDYDQAINDYDKAIALNPKYAEAYYNRGIAYDDKGNHDQAIKDFKKAADLGSSSARQTLKKYFNIDY